MARPQDLKSSSNVNLPSAWITGPATDPSSVVFRLKQVQFKQVRFKKKIFVQDFTLSKMKEYVG